MVKSKLALCNLFKPFDHTEHYAHRYQADDEEYHPAFPDRPCVVHQRAYEDEEVSYCGGAEPETLAETLHALWSHLRYE